MWDIWATKIIDLVEVITDKNDKNQKNNPQMKTDSKYIKAQKP